MECISRTEKTYRPSSATGEQPLRSLVEIWITLWVSTAEMICRAKSLFGVHAHRRPFLYRNLMYVRRTDCDSSVFDFALLASENFAGYSSLFSLNLTLYE